MRASLNGSLTDLLDIFECWVGRGGLVNIREPIAKGLAFNLLKTNPLPNKIALLAIEVGLICHKRRGS